MFIRGPSTLLLPSCHWMTPSCSNAHLTCSSASTGCFSPNSKGLWCWKKWQSKTDFIMTCHNTRTTASLDETLVEWHSITDLAGSEHPPIPPISIATSTYKSAPPSRCHGYLTFRENLRLRFLCWMKFLQVNSIHTNPWTKPPWIGKIWLVPEFVS